MEVVKILIREICELTGKTKREIEAMLKSDDVIELNLTER